MFTQQVQNHKKNNYSHAACLEKDNLERCKCQINDKVILNWVGLSGQAANESKRKISSGASLQLQRILLLTNTYE